MNAYLEMASYYATTYRDRVIKTQAKEYEIREVLMQSEGAQFVLLEAYKIFLKQETIQPIENLSQDQKNELVKEAGQSRVRCKMIHVINTINL